MKHMKWAILRISIVVVAVGLTMLGAQWWFQWPTDLTYGEIFRMYMGPGW